MPETRDLRKFLWGKGEHVGNQHFSPFPTRGKTEITFMQRLSSAIALNLFSKIRSFGKQLTLSQMPNFRLFQTEIVCR